VKKLLVKLGNVFMMLALIAAEMNVNATCGHHIYQEAVPETAKHLSKYK